MLTHSSSTSVQPVPAGGRRRAGGLAAVGLTALIAAGCGSAASKAATPTAAPAAPVATAAAPAPSTSAGAPAAAKITAKLTEFHIALSRTNLTAGTYTFVAVNAGHAPHALEINGPGVKDKVTPGILSPGRTADLTVTLQSGRYDVFCPVSGHKALGMDLELTVGAATGATSAASTSGGGSGY